jgi:hypothetical protein
LSDDVVAVAGTDLSGALRWWSSRGIDAEDARRWVAVLRRYAMPWTTQNWGSLAWPGKDWATVTLCLIEGDDWENPDSPSVRGWLRSGIPIDRAEFYLPAGLSVDEALQHQADETYDEQSLRLMAALRTRLKCSS